MLKKYTTFSLLVLLFLVSMTANAQDCVPSPTNPCPPPPVPIDSGIAIAIALGLAYGVKKLRSKQ